MSVNITTAFVEQYSANVQHLVQQKGSRLRGTVRSETIRGKNAFFDQIGSVSARQRTVRHQDTPQLDTPHSRRRVTLVDYDWADLIDQEDKVRMLIDPASDYAIAAMWAMGRAMDSAIIAAADGVAYTGVDGSTSTAYSAGQTVAITTRAAGVAAGDYGLNVAKLMAAKQKLDAADVDPEMPRYIAANARQMNSLLNDNRAASSDYNSIKALVAGELNTFMGFTFIRTERIGLDTTNDKVLYWAQDGLLLGVGAEPVVRISERNDKNHATQVFVSMAIGATRMEESKVGVITCHPSNGPG